MVKLTTGIQKIGGALGIYIPNTITKEMGLKKGDPVLIDIINGKIVIETI